MMVRDGFLNIDKPTHWTSHDVVAKIRGLIKIKKVGHLGTLDPDATGVLPICFGKGTKLAQFLVATEKEYETVLRLGEETDTEDASGKVVKKVPLPDSLRSETGLQQIAEVMQSFVGESLQRPPMYSAVKVGGVPLYKMARDGKTIDRPLRPVSIRTIHLQEIDGTDIYFRVICSKGTYIRTLCADIGAKLGVGAHLLSLRRSRSGIFCINHAIDLDSFSMQCKNGDWKKSVYSLNRVFKDTPTLQVKVPYVSKLIHGVQIGFEGLSEWESFEKGDLLRFLDMDQSLLAVGHALKSSVSQGNSEIEVQRPFQIKTVLATENVPVLRN